MPVIVGNQSKKRLDIKAYLRAPERVALAKILSPAFAAVFVLFILDASVFRTFYGKYLEPESYLGTFETTLKIERERQFERPRHALVIGDSQVAEGFSARIADELGAASGWQFLNAAVGGASLRSWYYMIRDLDPDRNRYDMIVLPLHGYPDVDDGERRADYVQDLRWMVARVRLSDIPELMGTFTGWTARLDFLRQALFEGLVYRRDLRAFLRSPSKRMLNIANCRAACAPSWYAYGGHTESLRGLEVDWTTDTIHLPPGLRPQIRSELSLHWNAKNWSVQGIEGSYRKAWLGRIIERYRGTHTRIVIFCLPYRPYPIPFKWPVNSESFIVQAANKPGVTVVDEHAFEDLQRPEYFWDIFHMNKTGREIFSRRLAAILIQAGTEGSR